MRTFLRAGALLSVICLWSGVASAQAIDEQAQEQAWREYQAAFRMCAASELERCEQALEALVQTWPDHPAAVLARGSLADLQSIKKLVKPEEKDARRGINGERFTPLARAELISAQTLHGIILGAELCSVADCSERPTIAVVMVGGGGGLLLSWLVSSDGLTPGNTLSLNSGTAIGAFNAGMLSARLSDGDDNVPLHLALGQGLGLGAGEFYYRAVKPTSGQVALTNSGGLWTAGMFLLGLATADPDVDGDNVLTAAQVMFDLGLVGGGFLAHYFPMSRSRVSLIDTGGLVGGLMGAGMFVLVGGEDEQALAGLAMAGGLAGLGLSTWLTQDWDDDDEDVKRKKRAVISLAPVPTRLLAPADGRDREGWGLQLSARW